MLISFLFINHATIFSVYAYEYAACITLFSFSFWWREGKIAFISIVNAVPALFSSHLNSYAVTTDITKHQISFVNGSVFFYRQMTNTNLTYFNWSDDWITNLEFWLQWIRSGSEFIFNWSNELVCTHFGIFHSISAYFY